MYKLCIQYSTNRCQKAVPQLSFEVNLEILSCIDRSSRCTEANQIQIFQIARTISPR